MEWKNEVSPEQLLLPFGGLLDGANNLCDQYAIGPRRIRASALPDHYARAFAASLVNTVPKVPDKQDSETSELVCDYAYRPRSLIDNLKNCSIWYIFRNEIKSRLR